MLQIVHRALPAFVHRPRVAPDVELLKVDRLEAEVLETLFRVLADVARRIGVGNRVLRLSRPSHVLRRDLRGVSYHRIGAWSAFLQRLAEELLALAAAVGPGRIEEITTEGERAIERAQRLLVIRPAPAGHAPHAVADFRDLPAGASKPAIAHIESSHMITHEIIGDDMQAVVLTLAAGDEVRAEAGAMTYMTDGIEMDARMEGGLLGGLKRKFLAGESLFLTFFRSHVPAAKVAFSGPYPGKIIRMPLQGSAILCQRDSFLCAAGSIDINIEFTKRLGAGFFGGEGFILQRDRKST